MIMTPLGIAMVDVSVPSPWKPYRAEMGESHALRDGTEERAAEKMGNVMDIDIRFWWPSRACPRILSSLAELHNASS